MRFLCQYLFIIGLWLVVSPRATAIVCLDEGKCQSQLLRVEVAPNILSNGGAESLLPLLKQLSESSALSNLIQKDYKINDLGFPTNKEVCRREKSEGDPEFKDVDCESNNLCSNPSLSNALREKICFKLPCVMLEGTLNAGKCQGKDFIYPTKIGFPGALTLKEAKLTPTKVSLVKNQASICFSITALEVSLNTRLQLETKGTQLPDNYIEANKINARLDSPREACVQAKIDLKSPRPVTDIQITYAQENFISEKMIRDAAQGLEVGGLSGYPASDLDAIKTEVLPALFHPLRSSVESGVRDALEGVFQQELDRMVKPLMSSGDGQTSVISSRSFMSELGIDNLGLGKPANIVECTILRATNKPIPAGHECLTYKDGDGKQMRFNTDEFNTVNFALFGLSSATADKNITSESFKQRVIGFKEMLKDLPPESGRTPAQHQRDLLTMRERLDGIIEQIEKSQLNGELYNFIEVQNQLRSGHTNGVGISLPEICDARKPSSHAGKQMANCPIQVYADLGEFNQLIGKMWETGRICMSGKGPFVPERDSEGKPLYFSEPDLFGASAQGGPIGSGCKMELGDGFSCYIKSPPKLEYDAKNKGYRMSVGLEACYRGAGAWTAYQGRFGGDMNINVSFKPDTCANGDFCMNDAKADWSVVPGTERYAFREQSRFREMVDKGINKAINSALGDSVRLPLSTVMGAVPLRAKGRVDAGPGYFGVCLELQNGQGP